MSVTLNTNNPVNYPLPQQSAPQGSCVGRTINWLNNTASGRLLKGIAWGVAGAAATLLAVATYIKGLALAIFGATTLGSGGIFPLIGGIFLMSLAWSSPASIASSCFNNMLLNFKHMHQLAKAGY